MIFATIPGILATLSKETNMLTVFSIANNTIVNVEEHKVDICDINFPTSLSIKLDNKRIELNEKETTSEVEVQEFLGDIEIKLNYFCNTNKDITESVELLNKTMVLTKWKIGITEEKIVDYIKMADTV